MSELKRRLAHLEKVALGRTDVDFETQRTVLEKNKEGDWIERPWSVSGPGFTCIAHKGETVEELRERAEQAKQNVVTMVQKHLRGRADPND